MCAALARVYHPRHTFHEEWTSIYIPFGIYSSVPHTAFVNQTEIFISMWSKWRSVVGASIADEDPAILVRVLNLAAEPGTTQTKIRKHLRLRQPRVSKLVKKLVRERLVKVEKSSSDKRAVVVAVDERGREVLDRLEFELSVSAPSKQRRKHRDVPGQQRLV